MRSQSRIWKRSNSTATAAGPRRDADAAKIIAWLPLLGLPALAALFGAAWPPWLFMWAMALALYAGLKWLTFADCPLSRQASLGRSLGYLLLWPGMDAAAFLGPNRDPPRARQWWMAVAKTMLGVLLICGAALLAPQAYPLLAGWLALAGLAFVLHFGLFDLLSICWRAEGVRAEPLMNMPILASSLGDFWGRRWNLAFRDVAHAYVFRPLLRKLGPGGATLAAFVFSGVIHDLVISLPAGAGWGLPTLYFVIQGCGILVERSRLGRRALSRLFCAVVTIAPVPLLFHRPFIERVILPMLAALGAM